MKYFLFLPFFLLVTACLDADATFQFNEDDTVTMSKVVQYDRKMADIRGLEFMCKNGIAEVTENGVTCTETVTETMSRAELIEKANSNSSRNQDYPLEIMAMTQVDEDTVQFHLDLSQLAAGSEEGKKAKGMSMFFDKMLVGHNITVRVKGYKIVETNGEISDDGTEAKVVIPLDAVINRPADIPSSFDATVKIRQTCRFLIFCD